MFIHLNYDNILLHVNQNVIYIFQFKNYIMEIA